MDNIPQHYRAFYVSYRKIKRNILKMSKNHKKMMERDMVYSAAKKINKQGIQMLPPFLFNDIICNEIKKINKFAENKYSEIIDNLLNMYKLLKSMKRKKSDFDRTSLEKQLDMIGSDIIHFDFYIRKNSKTIVKLGFYFDKVMNISINQWLLLSLMKEKFCNINIDNLIVYLSYLYTLLRSLNEKKDALTKEIWKPPDTFERTSTKFLIKYDDIVYTKVKIVKHLPYLIFDFSNEDLENHFKYFIRNRKYGPFFNNPKILHKKNAQTTETAITNANTTTAVGADTKSSNTNDHDNLIKNFEESQQITSVYFDNEEANCYIRRILRYENAQLIRFRWYGDNDGSNDKKIFIERKIHHEEWTGEVSTKERFELSQKYVMKYMTGLLNIQEYFIKHINKQKKNIWKKKMLAQSKKTTIQTNSNQQEKETKILEKDSIRSLEEKTMKNIELGKQIQKKILKEKLKPIIRTSYLRAAFQLTNNNLVRISIDTNISMLNEYVRKRENWCRLAEEALGKNEVIRLNYGIIEVKLKIDKMPDWINHILKTNNSINVYKYSKYQTAMAVLHPEKIKYIPIWIYNNIHEKFISSKNLTNSLTLTKEYVAPQKKEKMKREQGQNHKGDKSGNIKFDIEREKEREFELQLELCTLNDAHTSEERIYLEEHFDKGKINNISKLINYVNPKTEYISNYNTLQKWNMLDKTYIWLNNKYNEKNIPVENEPINLLKIDPKVNFAAERTFLHYILISIYIIILSLFLEKYKNKNRNIDFIIVSLFASSFTSLFFSYFMYLQRINAIQKRKTRESLKHRSRFDSFLSPFLFLSFLCVAVILSFYFNVHLKTKKIP